MLDKLNTIARQIASVTSIDDAVDLRNRARAVETYAKAISDGKTIERSAIVIRLRCERRLGELLAKVTKPGRKRSQDATIKDFGITKSASSRYQTVAQLPKADFERYVETAREPTTNGILRLVQDNERQKQRHGPSRGHNVITGDMSCLWDRLDDDSVDLFFTDPPYSRDALGCYSQLAELASSKLKPGGRCLAYCGKIFLPDVMGRLGNHLEYFWLFAIRTTTGDLIRPRGVKESWKAVVAFCKPPIKAADYPSDFLQGTGPQKDLHVWQQNQAEAEYLIERLTSPGDFIVDPFLGSGTTLAAAKKLGRSYLGCEIDSGTAKLARRRLVA
jgi:hypothetical protein